jgi:peptide/nickel transport system substrate-binding protein
MSKKHFWSLLLIAVLLINLAACGGGEATGQSPDSTVSASPAAAKDSVIISMDADSEPAMGFDPILGWATAEHTHEPLIQSTLLVTNADLTIGYDLATEYNISDDGLIWTFKIRSDVKFTDGVPLTAKDVAFTYNNALQQDTEADLSMLDSVEAPDDTTAVFHLNRPYSVFAYLAAVLGIVPEHAYDAATYGENPIGSGRYMLKQWDKGEQVILEANPDYYGDKPKIKTVTIVFMSEDASYAAAQSGQVDVAYTAPNYTVKPISGYNIISFKSEDIRAILLPCVPSGNTFTTGKGDVLPAGNDVTSNVAIRQAINYAVDRDAIVKNVLYGYGTVAYSDCVDEQWENDAMKVEYDPTKSKSILEADGWKLNADGIYEKDGLKAEFDLLYDASDSVRTGVAMAFTEMLKEIGIKVNPQGKSWDEINPLTYSIPAVFGAGKQDPSDLIGRYYTGKNRNSYSNPTVDKYIDEALAQTDLEASYEYWQKAQWDGTTGVAPQGDSPWIWLVDVNHIYFAKDGLNVIDNKIHPHGYGWTITNNVDQWYWD